MSPENMRVLLAAACPNAEDRRIIQAELDAVWRSRDDHKQYAQNNYNLYLAAAAERDEAKQTIDYLNSRVASLECDVEELQAELDG